MAGHHTEEEQLEALKRWWQENGKSTLLWVAVAVGGYFGWQGWQERQDQQAQAASAYYEQLIQVLEVPPGGELSEEQRANALHFSAQIKDADAGSLYAKNASLLLAGLAVEDNDLDKAAAQLRWILDNRPSEAVAWVAKVRLARVLLAQAQLDQALALLEGDIAPSFVAVYAEARGDVLLAMAQPDRALAAYRQALDSLLDAQSGRRGILQMKIDDLQSSLPALASAEDLS